MGSYKPKTSQNSLEQALILRACLDISVTNVKMTLQDRRGFGFIPVLVILLAVVIIPAFLVTESSRIQATPAIQGVFWRVANHNSTTSSVGEEVEAHVIVLVKEEYAGSITLKIRKDVSFWLDSDYATKTFPVNLEGGQTNELELAFTPGQPSAGRIRGYFIEVDFLATHTRWTMENSYPPRLTVLGQTQ
jgi:hypothetical protein